MIYTIILFFTYCAAGLVPAIQSAVQIGDTEAVGVVLGTDFFLIITSLTYCLISHVNLKLSRNEFLHIIPLGILIFITDFSLNSAYSLLPSGMVTMIHFMWPTIVCCVNVLIFKEKKSLFKFISILLSFGGLVLIYGSQSSTGTEGIIIAIISSLAYASYLVLVGRNGNENINASKLYFYTVVIETVISLSINTIQGNGITMNSSQIAYCALSGFLLATVGIIIDFCISKIGSSSVSLFGVFEPTTSFVVSMIITGFKPGLWTVAGCFLIIASLVPSTFEKK